MGRRRIRRRHDSAQPRAGALRPHGAVRASRRVRDLIPQPVIERFSSLGEHGAIWIAIGATGAIADGRRRGEWLAAGRRVALAYGVNQAIKVVVRRRRPADARAGTLSPLSFPSAHATTAFCGARSYVRLGLPAIPLYALATGLAASRLHLRVHHASDVLAGAALGTVLAR